MGVMASQITNLTIVYSTGYSGVDQRKHQSSASLAFVRGIHRWQVNYFPHKGPVTRKMSPFDDVIMWIPHTNQTYHLALLTQQAQGMIFFLHYVYWHQWLWINLCWSDDVIHNGHPGRFFGTAQINLCWPIDAIWRHKTWSTLVQVIAFSLTAASHFRNKCWLISEVVWHSPKGNVTGNAQGTSLFHID